MSLAIWIGLFVADSLFSAWVLFLDGADRLEGSFASTLLVSRWARNWTSDGIKLFVGACWIAGAVVFLIGLFDRNTRLLF